MSAPRIVNLDELPWFPYAFTGAPGLRRDHEVAVYPDEGVAFVEGLGGEVPLDGIAREHPLLSRKDWTAGS